LQHRILQQLETYSTNLSTGQAHFLIEVSSNEPYHFNGLNCIRRVCSCAELGGIDGNLANQVNIPAPNATDFDINGPIAINTSLSIPNNSRNWHFPSSFPPYVVWQNNTSRRGGSSSGDVPKCTPSTSCLNAKSSGYSININTTPIKGYIVSLKLHLFHHNLL